MNALTIHFSDGVSLFRNDATRVFTADEPRVVPTAAPTRKFPIFPSVVLESNGHPQTNPSEPPTAAGAKGESICRIASAFSLSIIASASLLAIAVSLFITRRFFTPPFDATVSSMNLRMSDLTLASHFVACPAFGVPAMVKIERESSIIRLTWLTSDKVRPFVFDLAMSLETASSLSSIPMTSSNWFLNSKSASSTLLFLKVQGTEEIAESTDSFDFFAVLTSF